MPRSTILGTFDRYFRIKEKLILLTSLVAVASTFLLSSVLIYQYRSVLLEKTFDVCRNLSLNVSRVSREELIVNDIYDNTRSAVASLRDSGVSGLVRSYVVRRDGRIVAHTEEGRVGEMLDVTELKAMARVGRLAQGEITVDGRALIRFADPIFVEYDNERVWLGVSVFDFDREEIYRPVNRVQYYVVIASLVLLVLAVAVAYVLSRRISRPIELLAHAAEEISQGHLGVQVKISNQSSADEISKLGRTFNAMSLHLRDSEQEKSRQAAVRRELEIAQDLQISLLPKNEVRGPYEFHGYMQTADEVGGDYYDCLEVEAGRKKLWWFLIGDVSGHGLSAGLTMLMAQTAVHTALRLQPDLDPASGFALINQVLFENIRKLRQRRYMTGAFYRADAAGNCLVAGLHLDTLVYRAGKGTVEALPTDGMWLGIEEDISNDVKVRRFKLGKGDLLFLYTDGLIEAMNAAGDLFGPEGLLPVLRQYGAETLPVLREQLLKAVRDFAGGTTFRDDLTFAMVRRIQ